MTGKRADYITWDEYFMGVALLSGRRSKDPSTQVGACIVSQDNKILSMAFQRGVRTTNFPGARKTRKRTLIIPNISTPHTVS